MKFTSIAVIASTTCIPILIWCWICMIYTEFPYMWQVVASEGKLAGVFKSCFWGRYPYLTCLLFCASEHPFTSNPRTKLEGIGRRRSTTIAPSVSSSPYNKTHIENIAIGLCFGFWPNKLMSVQAQGQGKAKGQASPSPKKKGPPKPAKISTLHKCPCDETWPSQQLLLLQQKFFRSDNGCQDSYRILVEFASKMMCCFCGRCLCMQIGHDSAWHFCCCNLISKKFMEHVFSHSGLCQYLHDFSCGSTYSGSWGYEPRAVQIQGQLEKAFGVRFSFMHNFAHSYFPLDHPVPDNRIYVATTA